MSKHRDRQFFIARGVFGLAAAILVGLVGWIAFRAGGPAAAGDTPMIVQPSANLRAAESTTAPLLPGSPVATSSPGRSASASPSASPSSSPSASASASPSKSSASPSPSRTSKSAKPSPSRTTSSPAAPKDLNVTYATGAAWDHGFVATLRITNNGSQPHDFTVTLNYPGGSGLGLSGVWNATGSVSGDTITIHGNSIDPGRTLTVGFQARAANGRIKPTGCSVAGGTCSVS